MAQQVVPNELLSTIQAAIDSAEAGTAKDPMFVSAGYFTINTWTWYGECTMAFSNHNEHDYDDDEDYEPPEDSVWCVTTPFAAELIADPAVDLERFLFDHIFRTIVYYADRWGMSGADVLDGFEFYPRAEARGPRYQWPVAPTPTLAESDPADATPIETLPYPPQLVDRIAEFDESAPVRHWMRYLVNNSKLPTPEEKAQLDKLLAIANQRKNERLAAPSE